MTFKKRLILKSQQWHGKFFHVRLPLCSSEVEGEKVKEVDLLSCSAVNLGGEKRKERVWESGDFFGKTQHHFCLTYRDRLLTAVAAASIKKWSNCLFLYLSFQGPPLPPSNVHRHSHPILAGVQHTKVCRVHGELYFSRKKCYLCATYIFGEIVAAI